jgi:hypothetical protein
MHCTPSATTLMTCTVVARTGSSRSRATSLGYAVSSPDCPGRRSRPPHRSIQTAHGRREIRTLKVVTIAAGIAFPHAQQAVQITRKTRPASARTDKRGRWHSETVYAVTDLGPHQARPDELATWIRGH